MLQFRLQPSLPGVRLLRGRTAQVASSVIDSSLEGKPHSLLPKRTSTYLCFAEHNTGHLPLKVELQHREAARRGCGEFL
jgi:hypothetical protein